MATAVAGETQSNSVSSDPPSQASAAAQAPSPSSQQPAQPTQRPLNPTQEVAGEVAEGPSIAVGPAQLRIGGYLGVTGLYRSTNAGGGTGTSFASFPYEDELQGNVSESRLTAQASRITIRVDADFPEGRPRFRKLGGYFEAHIEQGSTLESGNLKIGVVTGLVGLWNFGITAAGQQNHAGTTMMWERRDAGAALVRLFVAIDRRFTEIRAARTVWTVGNVRFEPGEPSIIPGRAEAILQFRDDQVVPSKVPTVEVQYPLLL
jgi:hypothetical protein